MKKYLSILLAIALLFPAFAFSYEAAPGAGSDVNTINVRKKNTGTTRSTSEKQTNMRKHKKHHTHEQKNKPINSVLENIKKNAKK